MCWADVGDVVMKEQLHSYLSFTSCTRPRVWHPLSCHQEHKAACPVPTSGQSQRMFFSSGLDLKGSFSTWIFYFCQTKKAARNMGSSAYENNVSCLWREGWKQNHSANSQMASTDCTVWAPSIFVLLFCLSRFQSQWPGKYFVTESWAWWGRGTGRTGWVCYYQTASTRLVVCCNTSTEGCSGHRRPWVTP